jgi:hypothetical protein
MHMDSQMNKGNDLRICVDKKSWLWILTAESYGESCKVNEETSVDRCLRRAAGGCLQLVALSAAVCKAFRWEDSCGSNEPR